MNGRGSSTRAHRAPPRPPSSRAVGTTAQGCHLGTRHPCGGSPAQRAHAGAGRGLVTGLRPPVRRAAVMAAVHLLGGGCGPEAVDTGRSGGVHGSPVAVDVSNCWCQVKVAAGALLLGLRMLGRLRLVGRSLHGGQDGPARGLVRVGPQLGSQRRPGSSRWVARSGRARGGRYGDAAGCREQSGQDEKEGAAGDHLLSVAHGTQALRAPRVTATVPSDRPSTSR